MGSVGEAQEMAEQIALNPYLNKSLRALIAVAGLCWVRTAV
jgi:hypothetical protein